MALSVCEFRIAAHALAETWKRTNPDLPSWTWVSPSTNQVSLSLSLTHTHTQFTTFIINGFLTLEKLSLPKLTQKDKSSQDKFHEVTQAVKRGETTSFSGEIEPVDSATLVDSDDGVGLHYDFHIVYSASFRVPILFFRVYWADGQPLSLDEIEKELPPSSSEILMESKWTFITQEEHPYLKRPWYKLHPCGTSEWLKLLFQSDSLDNKFQELYLVSWLSVVGQIFGLRIPPQMMNLHD